jgi:hypothetical protein
MNCAAKLRASHDLLARPSSAPARLRRPVPLGVRRPCGPASHFRRAVGLTLAFHRYYAHRAFKMTRHALRLDVHRHRRDAEGSAVVGRPSRQPHKFADREAIRTARWVSGVYYAHHRLVPHDTKYDRVEATIPGDPRLLDRA